MASRAAWSLRPCISDASDCTTRSLNGGEVPAAAPACYLPTMMIVKEPGIAVPRPAPRPPGDGGVSPGGGGGAGPTSDAIAKRWPVLLWNAIVRAPFDGHVFRSCSTSKPVGLFSLTMVIVPKIVNRFQTQPPPAWSRSPRAPALRRG